MNITRHFQKENFAIVTSRLTKGEDFAHVQVVQIMAEKICMSPKTSNNGFVFPLYLYAPDESEAPIRSDLFDGDDFFEGRDRIENLAPAFRECLDARYRHHFLPEEVLGYIYGVLHAPTYRERYRDFLRIDFPRIPLPKERSDFEALSALGWDLIQKHLLKEVPARGLGRYRGKGDNTVERPQFSEAEQAIYINATQHFAPVPQEVWEFHIGGYQVLAKYLKDRKGRTLTLDEIANVENVANVLAYTISAMLKIDDGYNKAFSD